MRANLHLLCLFPALALLALPAPGLAQETGAAEKAAEQQPTNQPTNKDALKYRSGLPVPRFASLRANRAYMRAGPGKQYPVIWVFTRPGVPLEVTQEWNVWRRVRDADGTEGWMDRAMLSTDRTVQIVRQTRDLRARPDLGAPVVLRAEAGVSMRVTMCADRWCRVEGQGRSGYLLREHAFGTYPDEPIG
ncbi:SH3 domain-containing protein [Sandaracinobacteroides sp. A072]|uniref:SH3 domain-containing protein n=1 Tax=Sandaracinobacteroides sp. A072 TaxID=3461146 RepID=UPI0040418602